MLSGKNIGIVLGDMSYIDALLPLIPLAKRHKVSVFTLFPLKEFEKYASYFHIESFAPVDDLAGYLRGFEKKASEQDLLIAYECTRVSSFQALLSSKNHLKKMLVYSTEWRPEQYETYVHILGMQKELMEYASAFFVPVLKAQRYLEYYGAPLEKIHQLAPVVDQQKFAFSEEKRKRFRTWLEIPEQAFMVLIQNPLIAAEAPEFFLKMLKHYKTICATGTEVKLLFVGDGDQSMKLKYLSFDLELGHSVLFLHQDPQPFLVDLYCACDAIAFCKGVATTLTSLFPFKLLEAMSCGLIPLVPPHSVYAELAGDAAVLFDESMPVDLALSLKKLTNTPELLAEHKNKLTMQMRASGDLETSSLVSKVDELLSCQEPSILQEELQGFLHTIEHEDRELAAEHILEYLSKHPQLSMAHKSYLFTCRGEILHHLGKFVEAIEAFEVAISHDEKNDRAYVGLGYLSLSSHGYEEAVTFFKKALTYASYSRISLGLGISYKGLALFQLAIFWFEKAVLEEDGADLPLASFLQSCRECPNLDFAIASLERVKKNLGDLPNLTSCLDTLYLKEKRFL
jgi:tetratricopeptide (TPR) repeat protein